MEKLKIFISSLLIGFVTFFAVGQDAEAATDVNLQHMTPTEAENIYYDEEYGGYYDVNSEGYIEVYEVEDGEVVKKVDMKDYIKRQAVEPNVSINDSLYNSNDEDSNELSALTYRYAESSNVNRIQFGTRSSLIQKNCGPGSDTLSLGYNATKGHSFNLSLLAAEKTAVKTGVNYTWSNSLSISSNHSLTIKAGYQGYWRFDPSVRVSSGTLYRYNGPLTSSKKVSATYPVKRGGLLDGELVSIKTKLPASACN